MPDQSLLDRGTIITRGLELGGNPDITAEAQTFLNVFLDHLSRSFDWPELQAETSVSSGALPEELDISGVSDYRAIRMIQVQGFHRHLIQRDHHEVWSALKHAVSENLNGDAEMFAVTPDRTKILLFPRPKANVTADMLYYRTPAPLTQDTDLPFYRDSHALVNAVAAFAARYDRDPLGVQVLEGHANLALAQARINGFDAGRATAQELKFEPSVFLDPPDVFRRFKG